MLWADQPTVEVEVFFDHVDPGILKRQCLGHLGQSDTRDRCRCRGPTDDLRREEDVNFVDLTKIKQVPQ